MSSHPTIAKGQADEQTWHEIEDVLHDLSRLAAADGSADEFYAELVDRAVRVLAAVGGAVWIAGADGTWGLQYQINLPDIPPTNGSGADQHHAELLKTTLNAGKAKAVPPHSGTDAQMGLVNPTAFLLLLVPLNAGGKVIGVLEVFQRPGASPAVQDGYLQFLLALSETAADFHRNLEFRELKQRAAAWGRFQLFTERAHGSLDLHETAYAIANEGRSFIGCDRLGLAHCGRSTFRVLAVSGLESVDRRANLIRRLEAVIAAVSSVGKPFWYADDSQSKAALPPQIETVLQAYLDESQVRTLAIIPLTAGDEANDGTGARQPERNAGAFDSAGLHATHRSQSILGALVLEWFDAQPIDDALKRRVGLIATQSRLALRNAETFRSLPFFSVLRPLNRLGWVASARRWPTMLLVVTVLASITLGLILVPADFEVGGRGKLQPQVQRDVFAVGNGIVHRLHVKHSQPIEAGDVLVELRDTKLDYEYSRVLGDIQTTRTDLATVQSALLSAHPGNAAAADKYHDLTARESLLKETLRNLEQQQKLLDEQRSDLLIRSPIGGHVLTWDVDALLESRPVKRGQVLLTVAELRGPWLVEMQVPDRRIGHILSAQKALGGELPVSFLLATDPAKTYQGVVDRVSMVTDIDDSNEAAVLVTVRIDREQFSNLRPGATVIPKIYCGRRSIGYVWFHDLLEFVQRRVLF
jgi:multidrug efflux pump subunit AcrA (membrane-fusion protein)